MKFLTACYWQHSPNAASLLLQQYRCGDVPVLFACISQGMSEDDRAGGYMTEQLLRWFREINLKRLAGRPERELDGAEAKLKKVIARADRELTEAKVTKAGGETMLSGIFCVGDSFCLFYRGSQRIYLANTGFGKPYLKRLDKDSEALLTERGTLQTDLGLLFAVEPFYEGLTEQMIREVLSVREVWSEGRLDRHLRELGEEAARQGKRNMAALCIRTARREETCEETGPEQD